MNVLLSLTTSNVDYSKMNNDNLEKAYFSVINKKKYFMGTLNITLKLGKMVNFHQMSFTYKILSVILLQVCLINIIKLLFFKKCQVPLLSNT